MNRTDFIKKLILLLGFSAIKIPPQLITTYQQFYLLQSFVRGFRFYEGINLLNEMNEKDMLELVREPQNQFDANAIALHFNNHKIGYVPKEHNEMLAKLLDADVVPIHAEITHLNKQAKAWENVHIAIYVLKESHEPVKESAQHLTVLNTPKYRSIKLNKDKIAHIKLSSSKQENEKIIDAKNLYNKIAAAFISSYPINNSTINAQLINPPQNQNTTSITTVLNELQDVQYFQTVIEEGRIVVHKNKMPKDLQHDSLLQVLEDGFVQLDNYFKQDGYVVANVNRLAQIPKRITNIVKIADNVGTAYYEILMS